MMNQITWLVIWFVEKFKEWVNDWNRVSVLFQLLKEQRVELGCLFTSIEPAQIHNLFFWCIRGLLVKSCET